MPGPGGPGGGMGGPPGGGMGGMRGGGGSGMGGFGGPGMGGMGRPPGGGMMGGMGGGSRRPPSGGMGAPPPRRSGCMGGMGCGGSMIAVLVVGLCLMASSCAAFTTSQNYIWTLVFVGILIAMVVILFVLKKRQEAREKETEATERMLKTPLEKYGDETDEELDALEKKYDEAARSPGAAGGGPVAFCPSCGAKILSDGQAFCASCGAALPKGGGGSSETASQGDSAAQSADSCTN